MVKPYYQDSAVTIYHGDCMALLAEINNVDCILTDPPYGLADLWTGGTWGANPMYADAKKWDRNIPIDAVVSLASRSLPSIIWGGNLYPLQPSRSWLAWEKSSKMQTMADFELAWTNLDRPSKLFKEDRNPDGKRQHPTQKPLSLMSWCICLLAGNVIFDPFMGSGTTLRAAKDMNKKAIGIEIEEKYCEIAALRMSQEVLQFESQEPASMPEENGLKKNTMESLQTAGNT